MLLLGIDLGTSSIKVSVVEAASQTIVASATFPDTEVDIIVPHPGWAEQSPDQWWEHVKQAILKCHATGAYDPQRIAAIGIAYQMHGLVLVDKDQHVLRNAIIWCDSRAVETGNAAFQEIGEQKCLTHLLNSPGNFTASKLAWVKKHEPDVYKKIHHVLLPGDFIAMKFTGEASTTISALSEGIFWDFRENKISDDVLSAFGFTERLFPGIRNVFAVHGELKTQVAERLMLKAGIPVSYKAGDQPNNALSLNVLQPGEVAATAGTSGVIYGVTDQLSYDPQSRINSFAHVNHDPAIDIRIGILLCINGAGIFNRWMKNLAGENNSYDGLNAAAASTEIGADGLLAIPFGNGAERMLNNLMPGAHFHGLDFNVHSIAHMVRAVQEGIAFSFRYGMDIMRENGIDTSVVRAARTNLFLSNVFTQAFASANDVRVEFYEGDGSFGAAIGAGIGAAIYPNAVAATRERKAIATVHPEKADDYAELYEKWKARLNDQLNVLSQKDLFSLSFP